jgi:hypothetical protein
MKCFFASQIARAIIANQHIDHRLFIGPLLTSSCVDKFHPSLILFRIIARGSSVQFLGCGLAIFCPRIHYYISIQFRASITAISSRDFTRHVLIFRASRNRSKMAYDLLAVVGIRLKMEASPCVDRRGYFLGLFGRE